MNRADIIFAGIGPLPQWLDFLVMTGAMLIVALGALIWAVAFRKKARRKRKHRRHHREHFQSNPALAQGGRPPARAEEKKSIQSPP